MLSLPISRVASRILHTVHKTIIDQSAGTAPAFTDRRQNTIDTIVVCKDPGLDPTQPASCYGQVIEIPTPLDGL